MQTRLQTLFTDARRVSVPIVGVRTADPAATISALVEVIPYDSSGQTVTPAAVRWDCVQGFRPINEAGSKALAVFQDLAPSVSPVEALAMALRFPKDTALFFFNAHRHIQESQVAQAVWNLRDKFAENFRTLVLLCPSIELPPELTQDVVMLDDALPTEEELGKIVHSIYHDAQQPEPDTETVRHAVDATTGLAAFSAAQVIAMSLRKEGLALDELRERKRQAIEQTPGLGIWRGAETFDQIGGYDNVKDFCRRLVMGKEPPRGIVFMDELEKMFAGSQTDSSGVAQAQHQYILTYMQDHKAIGLLFLGPPGSGKSNVAKAIGNMAGIMTITYDAGGQKSQFVGASEAATRNAFRVIDAVTQGKVLFIATCNSLTALSPELRRRFKNGTFFFDLPTAEARQAIWKIYLGKYQLADAKLPTDEGWTGAEIENCCDTAYRLDCSLEEAAKYIVPVSKSAADQINRLREEANGRFIDASFHGEYQINRTTLATSSGRGFRG